MKAKLKKILPEHTRIRLAHLRDNIKFFGMRIAAASNVFAMPLYFTSPHFFADFRSFASGSSAYRQRNRQNDVNLSLLRRDIHRLEKGLSFSDRRKVFALRFIEDAVCQFELLGCEQSMRLRSEFNWAHHVLTEYFSVTESSDRRYLAAKQKFRNLETVIEAEELEIPRSYQNVENAETFQIFTSLLQQRKSVRRYRSDLVNPNILEAALRAASSAPSSCNRQPYNYYLITDPVKAREAASISAGTAGWLHEIHNLAVLVGDRSYFANLPNRHSIYVDSTLSVMPFILSLEAQGISTCLINWADDQSQRRRMDRILGLSPHQRVVISIAFGHAHEDSIAPFSKRKLTSEISQHV